MSKPKLAFITLGCKANQYDSFSLAGYLSSEFELVSPRQALLADFYIINTCTVTHKADFQCLQYIRRVKKWNPHAKVIVTGCLAQAQPEKLSHLNLELVAGTLEREKLIEFLLKDTITNTDGFFYHPSGGIQDKARAVLKVQDGCNRSCSYCIIPRARGKSRSLAKEQVIAQLKAFYAQGFNEVILSGINLGDYGKDINFSFRELLQLIEKQNEIPKRIRLSSLEPFSIDEEIITIIASSEKICPHLHIALQSADQFILSKMGRDYKLQEVIKLLEKLSLKRPSLSLGMDIIVGFPEETQDIFKNSLKVLEEIPFSYLHIFPFSPRPRTIAEKSPHKIPKPIVNERARILRELSAKRKKEFMNREKGKIRELVVEEKNGGIAKGHSENYLVIKVATEKPVRALTKVRLKEVEQNWLVGEEIES